MSRVQEEEMQFEFRKIETHLRERYNKELAQTTFVDLSRPDAKELLTVWLESNRWLLEKVHGVETSEKVISREKESFQKRTSKGYALRIKETGLSLIAVDTQDYKDFFHPDPKINLRLIVSHEAGHLICEGGLPGKSVDQSKIAGRLLAAAEIRRGEYVADCFAATENIATGHITRQEALNMTKKREKNAVSHLEALQDNKNCIFNDVSPDDVPSCTHVTHIALTALFKDWGNIPMRGLSGEEVIRIAETVGKQVKPIFAAEDDDADTQMEKPKFTVAAAKPTTTRGSSGKL